jgi:hypothetical protein
MYSLSIDFKNNEDLAAFVAKLGGLPSEVKVNTVEKEDKTALINLGPAPKAKTKAEKAVSETVASAQEKVELPANIPPVIKAPATPAFNRTDAITKATETVKDLAQIVEGPLLAQHLADVYVDAGCPIGVKISQLDDDSLSRFMPLFLQKAGSIKQSHKPATPSGAFI